MQANLQELSTQTTASATINAMASAPPLAPPARRRHTDFAASRAQHSVAHDQVAFCNDAARLAALVCHTQIGAILLAESDGAGRVIWRLSGATGSVSPEGGVFLARFAEQVAAERAQGDFTENTLRLPATDARGGAGGLGFWAGAPLHALTPNGGDVITGVLCVAETETRAGRPHGLTPAEAEGLETLARQTAILLALAPAAASELESRRRIDDADARARLSREEAHAATVHAAHWAAQANATTAHVRAEKKRFCHDVIRCVTQGRFRLADEAEFPNDGAVAVDATVRAPEEYPPLRVQLRAVLLDAGMESHAAGDFLVAIGEAVTNSLKHAHGGQCTVKITPDLVRVRVCDDGPGIAQNALPDTILKAGFSTKASLGMGFTLMLEMSDAIWLATDEGDGAAIQLEKWIRPEARPAMGVPDLSAWDTL